METNAWSCRWQDLLKFFITRSLNSSLFGILFHVIAVIPEAMSVLFKCWAFDTTFSSGALTSPFFSDYWININGLGIDRRFRNRYNLDWACLVWPLVIYPLFCALYTLLDQPPFPHTHPALIMFPSFLNFLIVLLVGIILQLRLRCWVRSYVVFPCLSFLGIIQVICFT